MQTSREQGIAIGIASYGRHDVISEYLLHIFEGTEQPFPSHMIVTPSAFGIPDGTPLPAPGKPQMLSLLRERAQPAIADPAAVLFFEDDEVNVDDAHDAGYELSICTPEGFTSKALVAIETGEAEEDFDHAAVKYAAAWGHDPDDSSLVQCPSSN